VTDTQALQSYADILHGLTSRTIDENEKHELILRGILAALEEIAVEEIDQHDASQLLYEAAGSHPNGTIRRQAFHGLARLAADGKQAAVDLVYLLAVEKGLLAARQMILSRGWEPGNAELLALFDWFTALDAKTAYPVEKLGLITRAFFNTASPDLQKRLLSSANESKQKNWASIVTALQSGSNEALDQLVKGYNRYSSQERQLAIESLEQRACAGSAPAQEALCSMFLDQDDAQAKMIIQTNRYAPEAAERRALFFFLLEEWEAYNRLDFDHSLLTGVYDSASRPLRRRLMEHSRSTGQTEWLRDVSQPGEVRWPNDLSDADWELAIKRLSESDKRADLWRLAQSAPPLWSATILDRLAKLGWLPAEAADHEGFNRLVLLAQDCLSRPLQLRPQKTLHPASIDITCLAIHPEGKLLAAGSSDQRITLWDLPVGDVHSTLTVPAAVTRALAFDPAGEMIACASSDHRIRVINLQTGQMVKTLEGHRAMIRALAIHPGGRLMFSAGFDGEIRFWRFPAGPELKTLQPGSGEIFSLAITGAGQALVSGGIDRLARVWTIPEGAQARQIDCHSDTITHLVGSKTTDLAVSAGRDGKLYLWNSSSGGLIRSMTNPYGSITSLCLHPGDQVLASGHQDGSIITWSLSSGTAIQQFSHQDPINGLVFHPNGYTLYSSDSKGGLHVWSLRTLLSLRLAGHNAQPGAATELQERLKDHQLSGNEKTWLSFSLELARWRQRFDIELGDLAPIQIGEFDIELA
jgi:WD40 repeat protein